MSLDNVDDVYNAINSIECPICLESLENNIAILNCKHQFHYKCIQQWYWKKRKLMCPFCQCVSEIINIKNEIKEPRQVLPQQVLPQRQEFTIFPSYCCIIL